MKATRANGLVVGVADAAVGCARDGRIVTYALGSCIGLTAYDPVARVGGMLHFMLPQPAPSSESAILKPAMYGSTGVPMLTERLASRGAREGSPSVVQKEPRGGLSCGVGAVEIDEPNVEVPVTFEIF